MLLGNPFLLGSSLDWLLSPADNHADNTLRTTPAPPRAACLPAAEQQELVLAATALLSSSSTPAAGHQHHHAAQLVELLGVTSGSGDSTTCSPFGSAHTAGWALQQQPQQAAAADCLRHHHLHSAAPVPCWLTPSSQHCCSWLSPPPPAPAAPATPAPAGAAQAGGNDAAAAAGGGAQQVPPAAKRPRLEGGGVSSSPQLAGAALDVVHMPPAVGVPWEAALAQLQEFASDGDASRLDVQGVCAVLAAAAAAAGDSQAAAPAHEHGLMQQQQQLQQQLEALSVDACHVLLEELLHANSAAPEGGGWQLSDAALAFLLSRALLPKLRAPGGAAPKPMLACLAVLGRSGARGASVLVETVLASLLLSDRLLPVQVQLLVKLAKDVDCLQPRLLELLLAAALGRQAAARHTGGGQQLQAAYDAARLTPTDCCWCESHAQLMKHLLDMAPQLLAQHLPAVVAALDAAVQQQQQALAKSSGFGQLLMALLKRFAAAFTRQQVQQLQGVVGGTATFMTAALSTKLQQLSEQHAAAAT